MSHSLFLDFFCLRNTPLSLPFRRKGSPSKMMWEIKGRVGADQSKLLLQGKARPLAPTVQGLAVREPSSRTWERFWMEPGTNLQGEACSLCMCTAASPYTGGQEEMEQSKEGRWRQCPGKRGKPRTVLLPGWSLGPHCRNPLDLSCQVLAYALLRLCAVIAGIYYFITLGAEGTTSVWDYCDSNRAVVSGLRTVFVSLQVQRMCSQYLEVTGSEDFKPSV